MRECKTNNYIKVFIDYSFFIFGVYDSANLNCGFTLHTFNVQ